MPDVFIVSTPGMGLTGREVTKEASKIFLLDEAFSPIVKAIHWARSLYENMQRFTGGFA